MQLTISQQLKLDPTTVANFFMNARRRGHDRSLNGSLEASMESASETSSIASGNGIYNDAMHQPFNIDLMDIKPLLKTQTSPIKDAKAKMDDCIAAVCCGAGTLNDQRPLPSIFEQL